MQRAILEGKIGEKFGREWPIEGCNTLKDTFKLIDCQTEAFTQYLVEAAENNVDFAIQRGIDFIGEEELLLSIGDEDLIITEVPAGQKSGFAKILAAIAIVAVVYFSGGFGGAGMFGHGLGAGGMGPPTVGAGLNTGGLMAMSIATNLALAGVTQLMTKGPELDNAEENKGYLFNGPVNTTQQGLPVPVAYGEMVVGGAVISISYQSAKFPQSKLSAFKTAAATHSSTVFAGTYGSGELYSLSIEPEDPGD